MSYVAWICSNELDLAWRGSCDVTRFAMFAWSCRYWRNKLEPATRVCLCVRLTAAGVFAHCQSAAPPACSQSPLQLFLVGLLLLLLFMCSHFVSFLNRDHLTRESRMIIIAWKQTNDRNEKWNINIAKVHCASRITECDYAGEREKKRNGRQWKCFGFDNEHSTFLWFASNLLPLVVQVCDGVQTVLRWSGMMGHSIAQFRAHRAIFVAMKSAHSGMSAQRRDVASEFFESIAS